MSNSQIIEGSVLTEDVAVINDQNHSDTLTQASPSLDKIKLLIKDLQSDKNGDFNKLILSQDIFDQIKKSLLATIQSMDKNPSIFTRIAEYWGKISLWQKILAGLVITVPTLVLGIVAHVGVLLAVFIFTVLIYAGLGFLLNDHHSNKSTLTEGLTEGVTALADLMEITIKELNTICNNIAEQVDKFEDEIAKLQANNDQFRDCVQQLEVDIGLSSEANVSLSNTGKDLSAVVKMVSEKYKQIETEWMSTFNHLNKTNEVLAMGRESALAKFDEFSKRYESDSAEYESTIDLLNQSIAKLAANFQAQLDSQAQWNPEEMKKQILETIANTLRNEFQPQFKELQHNIDLLCEKNKEYALKLAEQGKIMRDYKNRAILKIQELQQMRNQHSGDSQELSASKINFFQGVESTDAQSSTSLTP